MGTQRDASGGGRAWRGPLGAALLVLLALAVYLPGQASIPPVDRDESRFAQASRQMFESVALPPDQRDPALHAGGLIVPSVAAQPRLNKPPLIYWAQAASAWACTQGDPARDAMWMYRLPSLLSALIAVLATWAMARTMMSAPAAWLSAAMLAACPVVVWEAHQARADLLLLASTTLAMWALHHAWGRPPGAPRGWLAPLAFWLALAAGVMTKGPITPLVVSLTALTLCIVSRRWRWTLDLRPLLGACIVLAAVVPWVLAVASRVGWGVYLDIVLSEVVGRSASPREGHWGPPGYHALLSAVLFWPGSLLALSAVVYAWRRSGILAPGASGPWRGLPSRWAHRTTSDPDALFLLAWLIPSWLVFESVLTKLPHYTLPLYPALALITGTAIDAMLAGRAGAIEHRSQRIGLVIWSAIGLALLCAAPIGLSLLVHDRSRPIAWGAAAVGTALVVGAARSFLLGRVLRCHALAIAGIVAFAVTSLGILLPRAHTIWASPRLMDRLAVHRGPIAALGYHEDSLLFLTRGRLERLPSADAARRWLAAHPDGLLIAPADEAATLGGEIVADPVRGFNYSDGSDVDLRIVRP